MDPFPTLDCGNANPLSNHPTCTHLLQPDCTHSREPLATHLRPDRWLQAAQQHEAAAALAARCGLELLSADEVARIANLNDKESLAQGQPDGVDAPIGATNARAAAVMNGGGLLPYTLPEGASVHLVTDVSSAEQALLPLLALLRDSATPPVLGVDAEWVASRPISLLQV